MVIDCPTNDHHHLRVSTQSYQTGTVRHTPVDRDFFRRSLPARSTRYSFPTRASSEAPPVGLPLTRAARLVTVSITSTWLRLECSFILVAPYALRSGAAMIVVTCCQCGRAYSCRLAVRGHARQGMSGRR